jgi:hypothetical protein
MVDSVEAVVPGDTVVHEHEPLPVRQREQAVATETGVDTKNFFVT